MDFDTSAYRFEEGDEVTNPDGDPGIVCALLKDRRYLVRYQDANDPNNTWSAETDEDDLR